MQKAQTESDRSFRDTVMKERVSLSDVAWFAKNSAYPGSCVTIVKTIERYGNSFAAYKADTDYQRSTSFSILQIGELSGGLSAEYR